jgi:replicative DNA helicase
VDASVSGSSDGARVLVPSKLGDALKAWRMAEDTGQKPVRIATPFPMLNHCLGGGLKPGGFYYLGARPSVGKTSLALDMARKAGADGFGVLIISLEMPEVDGIATRLLSQEGKISELAVRAGRMTDTEYPKMVRAYGDLAPLPIWVTDKATSLPDIERLVDRWPFSVPISLLIVDYLQLVKGPKSESRRLEIEAISRALRLLSVRGNVAILCVSALRRTEDGDKEPSMSDLKESGQLEFDGDAVLLLHRGFNSEEAKLIIAKNKYGPVGVADLRFRKACVSFEQVEESGG